ncbi:unnamed protein product [Arctia plantaginis]|uniref:C2H2-type domain-containing protein n=1 Tax=Arctia plantaginis TaxID=874455 RepID=A0A8S1ACF4_ARCPL|nr:unnamed protein product [Arctia plantaginis]
MLKKIKLFKSRVEEAQRTISHQFIHKQKKAIRSLSRLSPISTNNIIFITHNDKETCSIKHEIHDSEDNFNYNEIDSTSDHVFEIKKERRPAIKSKVLKSQKRSHYRLVYGPNVYKKSLLRKKFSIKPTDVPLWLEKDKCSQYFKTCRFRCRMCFEGFNSKEKLDRHNSARHAETLGPHICPTCRARFPTEDSLEAHVHEHMFARACARCGFECYTLRRLNAHIMLTHKLVQCVYCGLCLPNVREFRKHYREMHSVFECDHCGKRCKTKYMLEKHMSSHSQRHSCGRCGREYASRSALRKHDAAKHAARGAKPEDAYCVLCDKQFHSAPVYRRHLRDATAHAHETASSVKKVPCPECGNLYSRRAYMMNHYRHVHMNQSKYYCSHCDRHFLNRTRYVEHVRYNHEGAKKERNKLCNVCGRGFATNRILANHIRTHSGERPFECEHCSAKFTQKHSMLSHVKYIHMKGKRRPTWQTRDAQ